MKTCAGYATGSGAGPTCSRCKAERRTFRNASHQDAPWQIHRARRQKRGHGAIGLPSPPREISGYYLFNDRGIMSAPTDTLCGWELRTHPMKEMLVETISCILGLQWHPLPKPNWIPEIIPKCLQNESPNYKENRTQKQPKPTPKRFRNSPPNVTKWLHNCFLGGGPFG